MVFVGKSLPYILFTSNYKNIISKLHSKTSKNNMGLLNVATDHTYRKLCLTQNLVKHKMQYMSETSKRKRDF